MKKEGDRAEPSNNCSRCFNTARTGERAENRTELRSEKCSHRYTIQLLCYSSWTVIQRKHGQQVTEIVSLNLLQLLHAFYIQLHYIVYNEYICICGLTDLWPHHLCICRAKRNCPFPLDISIISWSNSSKLYLVWRIAVITNWRFHWIPKILRKMVKRLRSEQKLFDFTNAFSAFSTIDTSNYYMLNYNFSFKKLNRIFKLLYFEYIYST